MTTEVSSPAAAPAAETTEAATTPAVNGEKKDMKTDKRKSSFPFQFGKKTESTPGSPGEEPATSPDGEKAKTNPFSKFRATIKVSA